MLKSDGIGRDVFLSSKITLGFALPETNIFAPENGWLEYQFAFGMAYFQGRAVSFRECRFLGFRFLGC